MAPFIATEDIVHIKDVITLFVIVAVVLDPFARFSQDTPRVAGGFIFERGIAYPVGGRKVSSQGLQWLNKGVSSHPMGTLVNVETYADKAPFGVCPSVGRLCIQPRPQFLCGLYLHKLRYRSPTRRLVLTVLLALSRRLYVWSKCGIGLGVSR